MKLIRNSGTDRVLDLISRDLAPGNRIDLMSASGWSLFAFEALKGAGRLSSARLLVPADATEFGPLGNAADRPARNRLQVPSLAKQFAEWIRGKADVRRAPGAIPQGLLVLRGPDGKARNAVHGSFGFSTDGLGITPGNPLSFIQASESESEAEMLAPGGSKSSGRALAINLTRKLPFCKLSTNWRLHEAGPIERLCGDALPPVQG